MSALIWNYHCLRIPCMIHFLPLWVRTRLAPQAAGYPTTTGYLSICNCSGGGTLERFASRYRGSTESFSQKPLWPGREPAYRRGRNAAVSVPRCVRLRLGAPGWVPTRGGTVKYPVRNPAVRHYLRQLLLSRWQKVIKQGNSGDVHYFEHASGQVAGIKYYSKDVVQ
jgi:hypothetical protein